MAFVHSQGRHSGHAGAMEALMEGIQGQLLQRTFSWLQARYIRIV